MRSRSTVALIFVTFFVISLLTNILGPLVPAIIDTFHLDLALAGFLPFSFFLAYGLWSIPAGIVIEKRGEKPVLLGAFALALVGALLVATHPSYYTALASLFLIGSGMAPLQVALNPLLRVAGGEEHYAFNAVVAQLVFGLASFLSPRIYSHADHWTSMYWLFAAVITAMLVLIALKPLPKVTLKEDERIGGFQDLVKKPVVWAFFLAIFAYVGLEQGLANWMSEFLKLQRGLDPKTVGADAVSNFWGMMTVGCVLGGFLLKFFDPRAVLKTFSAGAAFALTGALHYADPRGFAACGFALSVMWSILFALALNSQKDHHGSFAGLLCTAIVGGAVVPLLIGRTADTFGLKTSLCVLYLPLAYIASVGFWAPRPQ